MDTNLGVTTAEHADQGCSQRPSTCIIAVGDSEKQAEMYERILRIAKCTSVYGADAGDVANEAWLLAHDPERGRGYFDSRMLREAARNLGLWRIAREQEIDDEEIPDRQESQLEKMIENETQTTRAAAVWAALWRLSWRCRAVVVMSHFQDMTLQEIGAELSLGKSRVHDLLIDAEEALRGQLREFAPRRKAPVPAGDEAQDMPLFSPSIGGGR